jgi:hypothetical protein
MFIDITGVDGGDARPITCASCARSYGSPDKQAAAAVASPVADSPRAQVPVIPITSTTRTRLINRPRRMCATSYIRYKPTTCSACEPKRFVSKALVATWRGIVEGEGAAWVNAITA